MCSVVGKLSLKLFFLKTTFIYLHSASQHLGTDLTRLLRYSVYVTQLQGGLLFLTGLSIFRQQYTIIQYMYENEPNTYWSLQHNGGLLLPQHCSLAVNSSVCTLTRIVMNWGIESLLVITFCKYINGSFQCFYFDGQCFMVKPAGLRCIEWCSWNVQKKCFQYFFFLNHNVVSYFLMAMAG